MSVNKKWNRYVSLTSQLKNWPSYFLFKWGLSGSDEFSFRFKNGMTVSVPRNSLGPFRECFFDDQYLKNVDTGTLPKKPVILDIGANVGYAALQFFYRLRGATVHSFEPMPYCISRIRAEQEKFPQFNWKLHPFGLWKEAGNLELSTDSTDGFSTTSGVAIHGRNQQKLTIQVDTLDHFFEENPYEKIDLCKVDCEGAEYETLFNTSDANLQKLQRIVMETHPTAEYQGRDMIAFLQKKGFTVSADGDYLWATR